MKMTRLDFVGTSATALAFTALPFPGLLAGPVGGTPTLLTLFKGNVNTSFFASTRSGAVELVLQEVSELPASKGTQQFSLRFVSPAGAALGQGTYTLKHTKLGTLQIFLVGAGKDFRGFTYYRADFNLLV